MYGTGGFLLCAGKIRHHAERFDVPRFKTEMRAFINAKMLEFGLNLQQAGEEE